MISSKVAKGAGAVQTQMHEILKNLVERLHGAARTNLESVILYGAAARGDFHPAHSDLNLLCTLRSLEVAELARIAPVIEWWTQTHKQPAPLFFTAEELQRSADVFAIEMLDMQESHKVLFGADVIAAIRVPMNLHRVQVEHELRTMLLKLRQHFLRAANNPAELAAILAKSFSWALTLLRHTLLALQQDVPQKSEDVLAKIASATGAKSEAFTAVLRLRESVAASASSAPEPGAASSTAHGAASGHGPASGPTHDFSKGSDASVAHGAGERGGAQSIGANRVPANPGAADAAAIYGRYLRALESVIAALDRHAPKRQWRRTAGDNSEISGGENA